MLPYNFTMFIFITALALLADLASCDAQKIDCAGINAVSPKCNSPELAIKRDYF
jgi:hypothetical protein